MILQAQSVLLIAMAVGVLWRAVLWRRRTDKNGFREVAVAATFLWCLVIVRVTFFPLTIIFYDWNGASNLIPFASILQLLRETPGVFAFENIVGNIVLFGPLGILLPALFDRLKRPSDLLWRAAVISLLIEGTQFLTRARSVDIDDVILNTSGAMVGLGVFSLGASVIHRWPGGRRLLGRIGSDSEREPLLAAVVPLLLTAAIAVPMLISTVVSQTLEGGADGIEAAALADLQDGEIVTRSTVEKHTFLLTSSDTPAGPRLRVSEFEKVLPSRYTPLMTTDSEPADGSSYRYSITSFNPSAGEGPILVVWGANADNATELHIVGNGIDTTVALDPGPAFVTALSFPYNAEANILDEFEFSFTAADGTALACFLQP